MRSVITWATICVSFAIGGLAGCGDNQSSEPTTVPSASIATPRPVAETLSVIPTPIPETTTTQTPTPAPKPTPTQTPTATSEPTTTTDRFVAISAGAYHTCALRSDGSPVCWGLGSDPGQYDPNTWNYGQSAPPQGETFSAISAGINHTCALRSDGSPVCWGIRSEATRPPPGETFRFISSGHSHTCALRQTDGTAVCWGESNIVIEAITGTPEPSPRPPEGRFSSIDSGGAYNCALRSDGTPVCWGRNYFGEPLPPRGEKFESISLGSVHTCALRRVDGRAVCWGDNDEGESLPPPIKGLQSISSGEGHACALRADGIAICWGANYVGQASPPRSERFTSISCGVEHTCAIRHSDGAVLCWGNDSEGQSSPQHKTTVPAPEIASPDTLNSTPIAADAIVTKLKEYITAGLIGEPEILVCDTQWPESACIGIEVGGLLFSGMNRETGRAFAIAIDYHDLLANVQTCQFEWLTPAATMLCDTDILDKEEAKLSLAYAVMTKWPELADKLTSVVK